MLERLTGRVERIAQDLQRWWPSEAADAVRLGLTAIAAIYLAMLLQFQKPEWAGWTVLSVSLATRASSLQKSLWRAVSSVVGAVIALVMTAGLAQATLAFDVVLVLWLAALTAAATVERGQRSYGFALMGFTVPIVVLGNVEQPGQVFPTAVDRCSTLLLGVACAHASSVLVAPGVQAVSDALAGRLDAAAAACADWLRAIRTGEPAGPPPVSTVLALDPAVIDAFTEQPSLQTGGRAATDAPLRLLHLLAVGLLQKRVGIRDGSEAAALLGSPFTDGAAQLRRVRVAGRLLRTGRRAGNRHAPASPLAIDRDGRQALNNAVRTATAVSVVNGFWYASGWPSGATAVTWAALVSVLFAARANAAVAARNFMVGALLAGIVGLFVHYTILTTTGDFPLLAAALLPVGMLAALARSDARAAFGGGYALVVLDIVGPANVMDYRLDATLNGLVADLIGMGTAVVAFTALPPPASAATRQRRTRRRMAMALRAIASRPARLLPSANRWLAQMFDRLSQLPREHGGEDGEALLLAGLLLMALRRDDDALGRKAGRIALAIGAQAPTGLAELARPLGHTPLQRDRIRAVASLLAGSAWSEWPGVPGEKPA